MLKTTLTNIHTKDGGITMLEKLYKWLFSEEEREPISFIAVFFMIVILGTVICLFIISVSRAIMWI